jgi:hypothetical protein
MLAMFHIRQDIPLCRAVALQLVRDEHPWHVGQALRVAGNLVRKYTLSYKYLFFKDIHPHYLYGLRQHPSGLLQTTKQVNPVYFLRIVVNRCQENGSRSLSLTSD